MTLDTWEVMDATDVHLADALRDPFVYGDVENLVIKESLRRILLYLSPETPGVATESAQDTPQYPYKDMWRNRLPKSATISQEDGFFRVNDGYNCGSGLTEIEAIKIYLQLTDEDNKKVD